ncbi:hypothetical protein YC2023_109849 [Brassica napus]
MTVLISNLLVESSGDEVDKVKMIPFEIEEAQGLPKTKHPFNCGIFLVKILECQSLKIGDMTKINDDNALELRRTLQNSCRLNTLAVSNFSNLTRLRLSNLSHISISLDLRRKPISRTLSLSRSFTRALSILREKPFLELYLFKDRNKMGDPLPLRLALPELRYPIGSEPEKTISINQHSIVAYIKTVKEILGNDEFNRIRHYKKTSILRLLLQPQMVVAKMCD